MEVEVVPVEGQDRALAIERGEIPALINLSSG